MKKLVILEDGTKIVHKGLFITQDSPNVVEEYDISTWSDEDFDKAKKDKKFLDKATKDHLRQVEKSQEK